MNNAREGKKGGCIGGEEREGGGKRQREIDERALVGITEVGAREEEGALAGTMKKKTGLEPPLLQKNKTSSPKIVIRTKQGV